MRLVIDTNVLVSHVIALQSAFGLKVEAMMREHEVLRSAATFSELVQVLSRKKFDRYVTEEERDYFMQRFFNASEEIFIDRRIKACRDERNNMFLELAVCGRADMLITGDVDLLALDPFEGIRIVDVRKFT